MSLVGVANILGGLFHQHSLIGAGPRAESLADDWRDSRHYHTGVLPSRAAIVKKLRAPGDILNHKKILCDKC